MSNSLPSLHAAVGLTASPRVLVVDDQHDICTLLRRVLERRGYDVTVTGQGREALALLAGARFDLLITDIVLPDASGWDLIRRARDGDGDVGVIVLTGWGDEDAAGAGLPVDRTLGKPFLLDEFQRHVTETLCAVQQRRSAPRA